MAIDCELVDCTVKAERRTVWIKIFSKKVAEIFGAYWIKHLSLHSFSTRNEVH